VSSTRNRRRRRLRTTDEPTARLIANATIGGCGDESGRKLHHSTPARARRPSCAKRAKTLRSRMRQIKPTDGGGPWRGATSGQRGHLGCSCGCGNHAYGHGVDCSVGRCASTQPSCYGHRPL
jgi:hypothetical protein